MSDMAATERSGVSTRWHAAGVIVFCFILGMVGRGTFDSFVVMLRPIDESHDWSRDKLTGIYAVAMTCWGLGAPLAGVLFDRFGPRTVYFSGACLLVGGLTLASGDFGLWSFYLGHGIAVGTGGAMMGNLIHAAMVSRWFDKGRTTALSLVHSSMGVGVLAFSPITQLFVDAFGWQGAYRGLAVVALCVLMPIILFAPWNRFAEGNPDIRRVNATPRPGKAAVTSLRQAMGTGAFWGLSAIYSITGVGMFVAVTQLVDYLQTLGMPALEAASLYGTSGALAPVGMIAFGIIADRYGLLSAATLSYALTLTSYAGFTLLSDGLSWPLVVVSTVCLGLTLGSRGPLVSTIASRLFQGPAFGRIYGAMLAFGGAGGGFGAWLGGYIHELTDDYLTLFHVGAVALIIGGSPFAFLSRRLRA
ncbi:MAG: MFS transporter [Pseudomonadota bacterium]|nr:MFS transporter [Pseudomonadota bacterium]